MSEPTRLDQIEFKLAHLEGIYILGHVEFGFRSLDSVTRPRSRRGTGGRGPAAPTRRARSC